MKVPNHIAIDQELEITNKNMSDELKSRLKRIRYGDYSFETSDSLYLLNDFFKAVGKPSFIDNIDDLSRDDDLDERFLKVLSKQIDNLFAVCKQNKFNVKNKCELEYNDIWLQNDKLCIQSEHMFFIVDSVENGFSVYASKLSDQALKGSISKKDLFSQIENLKVDKFKHLALEVKDLKVVFSDTYALDRFIGKVHSVIDSLESLNLMKEEILPENKVLTPDEYVIQQIKEYPSLYLSYSFENSKFKVLDRALNSFNHNFKKVIQGFPENMQDIEGWFGDKKVYLDEVSNKVLFEPNNSTYEIKKTKDEVMVPYANFKKEYSVLYSKYADNLDKDWKQAAFEFYSQCRDFFEDKEKAKYYYEYFSADLLVEEPVMDSQSFFKKERFLTNQAKSLVKDIKKMFEFKSNSVISEEYGVEFVGDPQKDEDIIKFLESRWAKEEERIKSFINETLEMLENDLRSANSADKKPKP